MKKSKKQSARLTARIKDWERTINDPMNRTKNMTGYHCPGSNKK